MAAHPDELLRHYRKMREDLLAAIEGLSDDELSAPVLDGWSVKDHLAHLAAWDELRASEVIRISAGHESACKMTDDQGDRFSALVHEVRGGLSVEQLRWELDSTHERLLDAIADANERGLESSHYGEAGLHSSHEAQHTEWLLAYRATLGR